MLWRVVSIGKGRGWNSGWFSRMEYGIRKNKYGVFIMEFSGILEYSK